MAHCSVIGAGIAGALTAGLLQRQGITVAIYEQQTRAVLSQYDANSFSPQVIAIGVKNWQRLKDWGVVAYLDESRCTSFSEMQVFDNESGATTNICCNRCGVPMLAVVCETAHILHALYRWLDDLNVAMCFEHVVSDISNPQEFTVTHNGENKTVRSDCTVLAQNNTQLLQSAGFRYQPNCFHRDQRAVVCVVDAGSHADIAHQWMGSNGILAWLPLADGNTRQAAIVWSMNSAQAHTMQQLNDAQFASQLGYASNNTFGLPTIISPRKQFIVRQQHLQRYVIDNTIAMGDAAHQLLPLAGQGANIAITDAAILSEEFDIDCITDSFTRWQALRHRSNTLHLGLMRGIDETFHQTRSRLPQQLRTTALRAFDTLPIFQSAAHHWMNQ